MSELICVKTFKVKKMKKRLSIEELLGVSESYKVPETIMKLMYSRSEREEMFWKFMINFDYDLTYDWFQQDFEENHADRGKSKQDFTPPSITKLLNKIVDGQTVFEPAAGNGGILISRYAQIVRENGILNQYNPNDYFYIAEDLNDRSMPFLLFNLTIRGMNAVVIHCDSLTRECKGVLFIYNFKNDPFGFSDFNVMPYDEQVEREFNVKFTHRYYDPHIESELILNG